MLCNIPYSTLSREIWNMTFCAPVHKCWNHSASVASVFEHLIKTRICVSERTNCAKVGKTEGRGRGRWYNPPNGNLSQKCRKSRGVLDFGKTPADLQKM